MQPEPDTDEIMRSRAPLKPSSLTGATTLLPWGGGLFTCGSDSLAPVGVLHVASREDAGHRGISRTRVHLNVALVIQGQLLSKRTRRRQMSLGVNMAGCLKQSWPGLIP